MEFANYFDIIICLIILIVAMKGIFTGFVRETFSIIGIIGGVSIASRFNTTLVEFLQKTLNVNSQTLLNLIGFMVILAAIWILSLVLAEVVMKFVRLIKLGIFDRILGVVISGVKAFLIISIIFLTFSKIEILANFTKKLEDSSFIYPSMISIGSVIMKTDFATSVRENAIESVQQGMKELNQSINETPKAADSMQQEKNEE